MTIEELEIIIKANITDAMTGIKKITSEVKQAVIQSAEPMKNLMQQTKMVANQGATSVSKMKSQIKSYGSSVQQTAKQQEYLKSQIEDLKDKLAKADMGFEVGDTMKIEADIEKLENRFMKLQNQGQNTGKETSKTFDKVKTKVKSAQKEIVGLSGKIKNVFSNSKNLGKTFTSTFNNGIKSVKKFALGLLSIRTAFAGISRAAQSYLSFDTQLSNSIQNCWNVLGSLLAPILETVVSLFSKAVSYVNAFITALTGINLVAKANAKALNAQGKAAKKANESQSSLDEFHTVSKDTGSGSTSAIKVDEIDDTPIKKFIEKVKSAFETLKEYLKTVWESEPVQAYISMLTSAFDFIKNLVIQLGLDLWNNIVLTWSNIQENVSTILSNISTLCTTCWADIATGIQTWEQPIIDGVSNLFNSIWKDAIDPAIQFITHAWESFTSILLKLWNEHGKSLVNNIGEFVTRTIALFQSIWDFIIEPIVTPFLEMLTWLWDEHLSILVQKIGDFIFKLMNGALEIYNGFIQPLITWLLEILAPAWSFSTNLIMGVLGSTLAFISDVVGSIIGVFGGLIDFITGVFTGNWRKAWQGVSSVFKNVVSGLVGIFKFPINLIIDGLNAFISGLNKIKIPDWVPAVGGKGINIPKIPKLASGGVLTEDTIVRVAEYSNAKSNPEIVSPRDMMKQTMLEALEETKDSQPQKVEVDITGELVARGDDLVYTYDKTKNNKGYDGKNNPSFAY